MNTQTIQFPKVHYFGDYHTINSHASVLSKFLGVKVYGEEINYDINKGYVGIFYIVRDESVERMIEEISGPICKTEVF